MALPFRRRIFLILVVMTTVPTVLAVAGWLVSVRRLLPAAGARASARERELEAERLRAFREVARRVAHEIKNPLTSMRIAVDQLERTAGRPDGRTDTAVQVLSAETDRLERLAKEFADFGRLPEGPPSEVDLVELLEELGRTSVPDEVAVRLTANGGPRMIVGHYEPLRRAFANLYRNAAEAM